MAEVVSEPGKHVLTFRVQASNVRYLHKTMIKIPNTEPQRLCIWVLWTLRVTTTMAVLDGTIRLRKLYFERQSPRDVC